MVVSNQNGSILIHLRFRVTHLVTIPCGAFNHGPVCLDCVNYRHVLCRPVSKDFVGSRSRPRRRKCFIALKRQILRELKMCPKRYGGDTLTGDMSLG